MKNALKNFFYIIFIAHLRELCESEKFHSANEVMKNLKGNEIDLGSETERKLIGESFCCQDALNFKFSSSQLSKRISSL